MKRPTLIILYARRTGDDPDASFVARVDYVLVLLPVRAAFRCDNVRDSLVIRPLLGALDVFLRKAHRGMVTGQHTTREHIRGPQTFALNVSIVTIRLGQGN